MFACAWAERGQSKDNTVPHGSSTCLAAQAAGSRCGCSGGFFRPGPQRKPGRGLFARNRAAAVRSRSSVGDSLAQPRKARGEDEGREGKKQWCKQIWVTGGGPGAAPKRGAPTAKLTLELLVPTPKLAGAPAAAGGRGCYSGGFRVGSSMGSRFCPPLR